MTKRVRVRYAPSPTGHLHIGGARTALFNYLFAKHHDGDFIIRIEDTDVERNIEGGEASQLENLAWLGIEPDESPQIGGQYGPYRQMERLDIYRQHTEELLEKGFAFKCFCTAEELQVEREAQMEQGLTPKYNGKCRHLSAEEVASLEAEGRPYTVRVKVPENVTYTVNDMVRGEVTFQSEDIGDWVLVKANGIPTYNYAVVIDDHLMEMTHVFRGEEHLTNTPKQLMIYEMFGWEAPTFAHMTLIVNEERKKLSKRDESIIQFVSQYRDLGYLPEAMFNFFALLGWSPEEEEEIYSKEALIKNFNVERLTKSPSMFDKVKLEWINNRYIKEAPLSRIIDLAVPHLVQAGKVKAERTEVEQAWVEKLVALYKDQMSYGAQIVGLSEVFFKDELILDDQAQAVVAGETVPEVLQAFLSEINTLEAFAAEGIQASIKATQKATGQKGKNLFMPIRVATTGQTHGPDLPKAIELVGKEKVQARIASFLS